MTASTSAHLAPLSDGTATALGAGQHDERNVPCRHSLHEPLDAQQRALTQKLRGHYGYYGITGNSHALTRFAWEVKRRWRKWLARRRQKRRLNWEKFEKILDLFPLPRPIAIHSVLRLGAKP